MRLLVSGLVATCFFGISGLLYFGAKDAETFWKERRAIAAQELEPERSEIADAIAELHVLDELQDSMHGCSINKKKNKYFSYVPPVRARAYSELRDYRDVRMPAKRHYFVIRNHQADYRKFLIKKTQNADELTRSVGQARGDLLILAAADTMFDNKDLWHTGKRVGPEYQMKWWYRRPSLVTYNHPSAENCLRLNFHFSKKLGAHYEYPSTNLPPPGRIALPWE